MNDERYARIDALIGKDQRQSLADKHILVVGLGGVGGFVVETLARSGITNLDIVDFDIINPSNLNRQIIAIEDNIGIKKTVAWENRLKAINSQIKVKTFDYCIKPGEYGEIRLEDYDYIVDCIDMVSSKVDLIRQSHERGIPCISSLGTGRRLDPTQLVVTDISKTNTDPLARRVRVELRKAGINHHLVVYSLEKPLESDKTVVASMMMVPSSAGILIAYKVIKDLLEESHE